jgi:hypothetical protein
VVDALLLLVWDCGVPPDGFVAFQPFYDSPDLLPGESALFRYFIDAFVGVALELFDNLLFVLVDLFFAAFGHRIQCPLGDFFLLLYSVRERSVRESRNKPLPVFLVLTLFLCWRSHIVKGFILLLNNIYIIKILLPFAPYLRETLVPY